MPLIWVLFLYLDLILLFKYQTLLVGIGKESSQNLNAESNRLKGTNIS